MRRPQPSTTAKGYGYHHQRERKRWQAVIDANGTWCRRCGGQIYPGMAWDLDHAPGKEGYRGPSHRKCNRRAGGRVGAALTNGKRWAEKRKNGVSRQW